MRLIRVSPKRHLSDFVEESALQVVSTTEYVGSGFAETLSTAGSFDSTADLQRTLAVILMYSILWSIGLFGLGVCALRNQRQIAAAVDVKKKKMLAGTDPKALEIIPKSTQHIISHLMAYVDAVLPSVYQSNKWFHRMLDELSRHHRYLILFVPSADTSAEQRRMRTGIQLLTVQSVLLFILAVTCDLSVSPMLT